MTADQRFVELWNDHLEGELDETGAGELCQLLAQDDRLVRFAADSYRTHRLLGLMVRDSESQQDDFVQQTLSRLPAEEAPVVGAAMPQVRRETTATTDPRTRSLDIWRWIMRSPVSRAAALVLAIAGVALWFHGGGATPAFAEFIAPIIEAKTAKFKVTTEIKGPPAATITGEVMVLGARGMRHEMEAPNRPKGIMIVDWGRKKSLTLDPATKKAMIVSLANLSKEQVAQQDLFGTFRSILLDARDNPDVKREPLGEKEIDGRRVVGFRVRNMGMVVSLWGDPKSGLPVLAESTMAMYPDAKTTMSDFVFDVDLDESLFSVEPPADYTVDNMEVDVSPAAEKDLIETFRIYTQLSDGVFPDSLDMQPMMQAAAKMVGMKNTLEMINEKLAPENGKLDAEQRQELKELIRTMIELGSDPGKEQPNQERMAEIQQQMDKYKEQLAKMAGWKAVVRQMSEASMKKFMEIQVPLQRGLLFVFALPPEADTHYAGKGVSSGAAETPIFWHRPKDASKYRVIYADLSVREADTPPNVPNAQRVPAKSTPQS